MNASPTIEYKWADGKKVVKALDVSACEYVRYLNEWIEVQVFGKGFDQIGKVGRPSIWEIDDKLSLNSFAILKSFLGLENLVKKLCFLRSK